MTEELAARVYPFEDPIGKSIRLGELSFTIVGVFRERVATFITSYGKGKDGPREEANLKLIHDISGFARAGNAVLVPFVDIEYSLEKRRATSAQWVSEAAREARFHKIAADHDAIVKQLDGK